MQGSARRTGCLEIGIEIDGLRLLQLKRACAIRVIEEATIKRAFEFYMDVPRDRVI